MEKSSVINSQEFVRYARQLMVTDLGEEAQEAFKKARVAIIGLGGLGCPASLYLAGAGIGHLLLIDRDRVEMSNLYRQVLYRDRDIGQHKAEIAALRLQEVNPHIRCEGIIESVDRQELGTWLERVDLVLDCTDNLQTRLEINRACVAFQTPLISAAAIGWEGQLVRFRFDRTPRPCLACIFRDTVPELMMDCDTAGVIGPVLGTLGSMQATQALKMLADLDRDESCWMQRYDGRQGRWLSSQVMPVDHCPVCNPHAD